MSHCLVTAEFADGEYSFALYLGQWEELQEITNCGPIELFVKLSRLEFRARWLREIIRLALIGGGMKPADAKRMIERYVDTVPFGETVPLALLIVARACYRPEDELKKKDETNDGSDHPGSSSLLSTETVQ